NAARNLIRVDCGFREDSLMGFRNVIENLAFIEQTPGIDRLQNQFRNIPAIVIATGPSLTKSLPLLKELQNKALLLSVDASFKILLENGIVPHFVASLERDDHPRAFFEKLNYTPQNT